MILSNQVRCQKCGDTPFSATRHDFKYCKCGAIAVDGGISYLRRVGDIHAYDDMSIEINNVAYGAAIESIKWAHENRRNELGVLSAVARALRDNGVAIFDVPARDPIVPNSDEEMDLEQAAFSAVGNPDVPEPVRRLVEKLWAEVCARETAVLSQGRITGGGGNDVA